MSLLLATENVSSAMSAIQIVFSAVVSLSLWKLSAWQRRYEGLEHRLHEATGRLIDERIRVVTTELECHTRAAGAAQDELRQRLATTEHAISTMADRDLKTELTLTARIDLLKDYIREFALGKNDLDRYESSVDRRLTRIENRLEEMAG